MDTTGAGDAFTAGLLAAWLAAPEGDPGSALDAGLALAAEVVGRPGRVKVGVDDAGRTSLSSRSGRAS